MRTIAVLLVLLLSTAAAADDDEDCNAQQQSKPKLGLGAEMFEVSDLRPTECPGRSRHIAPR